MKIRQGFVSNSSSSSFIASGADENDFIVKIDLKKFGTYITTEDKFVECYIDQYGCDPDDDNKFLAEIRAGRAVVFGSLDYGMISILDQLPRSSVVQSDD